MATADEEAMEGGRGGFGVEEATGPVGAVSVGGEGRGRRSGILRTTRVGCVGVGRVPPEDRGEDSDGEEGGPGPP
jgi:hypothetical protein